VFVESGSTRKSEVPGQCWDLAVDSLANEKVDRFDLCWFSRKQHKVYASFCGERAVDKANNNFGMICDCR
jgi:hypothetical protein